MTVSVIIASPPLFQGYKSFSAWYQLPLGTLAATPTHTNTCTTKKEHAILPVSMECGNDLPQENRDFLPLMSDTVNVQKPIYVHISLCNHRIPSVCTQESYNHRILEIHSTLQAVLPMEKA